MRAVAAGRVGAHQGHVVLAVRVALLEGRLSHHTVAQLSHNTGAFRARCSAFVIRRLVAACYGCSIVVEQ